MRERMPTSKASRRKHHFIGNLKLATRLGLASLATNYSEVKLGKRLQYNIEVQISQIT